MLLLNYRVYLLTLINNIISLIQSKKILKAILNWTYRLFLTYYSILMILNHSIISIRPGILAAVNFTSNETRIVTEYGEKNMSKYIDDVKSYEGIQKNESLKIICDTWCKIYSKYTINPKTCAYMFKDVIKVINNTWNIQFFHGLLEILNSDPSLCNDIKFIFISLYNILTNFPHISEIEIPKDIHFINIIIKSLQNLIEMPYRFEFYSNRYKYHYNFFIARLLSMLNTIKETIKKHDDRILDTIKTDNNFRILLSFLYHYIKDVEIVNRRMSKKYEESFKIKENDENDNIERPMSDIFCRQDSGIGLTYQDKDNLYMQKRHELIDIDKLYTEDNAQTLTYDTPLQNIIHTNELSDNICTIEEHKKCCASQVVKNGQIKQPTEIECDIADNKHSLDNSNKSLTPEINKSILVKKTRKLSNAHRFDKVRFDIDSDKSSKDENNPIKRKKPLKKHEKNELNNQNFKTSRNIRTSADLLSGNLKTKSKAPKSASIIFNNYGNVKLNTQKNSSKLKEPETNLENKKMQPDCIIESKYYDLSKKTIRSYRKSRKQYVKHIKETFNLKNNFPDDKTNKNKTNTDRDTADSSIKYNDNFNIYTIKYDTLRKKNILKSKLPKEEGITTKKVKRNTMKEEKLVDNKKNHNKIQREVNPTEIDECDMDTESENNDKTFNESNIQVFIVSTSVILVVIISICLCIF